MIIVLGYSRVGKSTTIKLLKELQPKFEAVHTGRWARDLAAEQGVTDVKGITDIAFKQLNKEFNYGTNYISDKIYDILLDGNLSGSFIPEIRNFIILDGIRNPFDLAEIIQLNRERFSEVHFLALVRKNLQPATPQEESGVMACAAILNWLENGGFITSNQTQTIMIPSVDPLPEEQMKPLLKELLIEWGYLTNGNEEYNAI